MTETANDVASLGSTFALYRVEAVLTPSTRPRAIAARSSPDATVYVKFVPSSVSVQVVVGVATPLSFPIPAPFETEIVAVPLVPAVIPALRLRYATNDVASAGSIAALNRVEVELILATSAAAIADRLSPVVTGTANRSPSSSAIHC